MRRPTTAPGGWTYSEYARLPDDGNHYEVIDGEVCVTPAPGPRHQKVAGRFYRLLIEYVEDHDLGEVFWDVDLLFQPGQYLRPDLLFLPTAALDGVTDRGVESPPGLVVEVASPHSGRIDRIRKPPRYRDFGVPEYWVVDPAERTVEVYRAEADPKAPEVRHDRVTWRPVPDAPALMVDLAKVFTE